MTTYDQAIEKLYHPENFEPQEDENDLKKDEDDYEPEDWEDEDNPENEDDDLKFEELKENGTEFSKL